jgi:hypothetical protein
LEFEKCAAPLGLKFFWKLLPAVSTAGYFGMTPPGPEKKVIIRCGTVQMK